LASDEQRSKHGGLSIENNNAPEEPESEVKEHALSSSITETTFWKMERPSGIYNTVYQKFTVTFVLYLLYITLLQYFSYNKNCLVMQIEGECRLPQSFYNTGLRLKFSLIILVLFFLIFPGCTKEETPKKVSLYKRAGSVSNEPEQPQPNTLLFGFDPRLGPKEEIMIYTPFLKYLEKATGRRFRIKFTARYEDTIENLGKGITHFAAVGTLSYVIGKDKYGSKIKYLVSGVNKEGDPRYHAMIFTRPDSEIQNIKDLKGKCFAFGSKMSTQGHIIPRKMLEDAGITLEDLGNYIYTGSHINAVKAVLNGECDAGGIQDVLAKRLVSEGKIKIIKISEPYPSSVIAYNSHLDSRTVELVKSTLLAFEPVGKHKHMLYDWDKTEMSLGFTRIDELELQKVRNLAKKYGLLEP
jgi:phosphonate transport system substrate-binding protein